MLASEMPAWAAQVAGKIRAASLEKGLERCARVLDAQVERQFEREQGPDGASWKPWRWRPIKARDDHKTLHISGRLRDSFIFNSSEHVEEIDGRELRYGSKVPYASTHDQGAQVVTRIPLVGRGGKGYLPAGSKINIPARPIVGWARDSVEECEAILQEAAYTSFFGGKDAFEKNTIPLSQG